MAISKSDILRLFSVVGLDSFNLYDINKGFDLNNLVEFLESLEKCLNNIANKLLSFDPRIRDELILELRKDSLTNIYAGYAASILEYIRSSSNTNVSELTLEIVRQLSMIISADITGLSMIIIAKKPSMEEYIKMIKAYLVLDALSLNYNKLKDRLRDNALLIEILIHLLGKIDEQTPPPLPSPDLALLSALNATKEGLREIALRDAALARNLPTEGIYNDLLRALEGEKLNVEGKEITAGVDWLKVYRLLMRILKYEILDKDMSNKVREICGLTHT